MKYNLCYSIKNSNVFLHLMISQPKGISFSELQIEEKPDDEKTENLNHYI